MLSINYSSAIEMSVIDGGGGLSALRTIDTYCRKEMFLL